jgi:D-glycero-D-manno-heptose 1,7-bisphosphate phosphatase
MSSSGQRATRLTTGEGAPAAAREARPAVFLDRDGVINENLDGTYVMEWEEFSFLPGAVAAIAEISRAAYPIVVVTNQQGIGKGVMTIAGLEAIHTEMRVAIEGGGGKLEAVLYCPHLEAEACVCRKPRPGMLQRAAQELGLDLARSFFVGDSLSDVAAARAAKCQPVLVRTGRGTASLAEAAEGELDGVPVVADLAAAARLILVR